MLIVAAIVGIDIVIAVTREVVDPVEITSNIIGTIVRVFHFTFLICLWFLIPEFIH